MSTIQDCLAGEHHFVVKGSNVPSGQWIECIVCGTTEDERGVRPGAKFLEAKALAELRAKAEAGEIAPTCRTCPSLSSRNICRAEPPMQALDMAERCLEARPCMSDEDFCSRHPLYPFWAMGECLRRVREVGNG